MSVNISVSGKTLKECHEQILALANEITGDMKESVKDPITSQSKPEPFMTMGEGIYNIQTMSPNGNIVKFDIGPTSAPTVTPVAESADKDSRGLPWDARIHSSNKEKSEKTGEWRRRRGVSPELEKEVEAELLGQPAKKAPPFGSMSTEQYQQVVAKAPAPMPTTEVHASLPAAPDLLSTTQITQTAPTFAPPVLPANTHNAESFRLNLINILNDLAAAGKINHDWLAAQKPMFGGKDIVQWSENKTACDSLFEAFVGWGLVNKL